MTRSLGDSSPPWPDFSTRYRSRFWHCLLELKGALRRISCNSTSSRTADTLVCTRWWFPSFSLTVIRVVIHKGSIRCLSDVSTLRPVFALRKRAMSFRMFHFMRSWRIDDFRRPLLGVNSCQTFHEIPFLTDSTGNDHGY